MNNTTTTRQDINSSSLMKSFSPAKLRSLLWRRTNLKLLEDSNCLNEKSQNCKSSKNKLTLKRRHSLTIKTPKCISASLKR